MKKIITAMFVCFVVLCALSSCDMSGKQPNNNISSTATSSEDFHQNRKERISDLHNLTIEDMDENILVNNSDIEFVEYGFDEINLYHIKLTFTDSGTEKFAEVTRNNLNKKLLIKVDEQIVAEPTINGEITDGIAIITGFDGQEALDLFEKLT